MRVQHRDLIDFAPQKFFHAEFRDWLRLNEAGRIFQLKICQQFTLCARDKLSGLLSRYHKICLGRIKVRRFAKEIRVQCSAESLVRADN
jgi:hypothetical protein